MGGEGGRKETKDVLVATNIVASQPPEHRQTGTPIARAKSKTFYLKKNLLKKYKWKSKS